MFEGVEAIFFDLDGTWVDRRWRPVVCVPYGYNHGRDIREAHPDLVIDSIAELSTLLRKAA